MFRSKGKMSIEEEMYGEDYQLCEGTQISEEDDSYTSSEEYYAIRPDEYDTIRPLQLVRCFVKWVFKVILTLVALWGMAFLIALIAAANQLSS